MITMTDERYEAASGDGATLAPDEVQDGWHFCCEWDFLLIHPSWGEAAVCRCLDPELLARYAPERASGDGA